MRRYIPETLYFLDTVSETKTTHEPISKSIPESSTLHKPIPKSIPESSTVHKPIPKYIPEFNTVHEHIPQTIPETTPATVPLPVFDKKNLRKSPKNQNQKLPLSSLHIKPENSLQRPSNLKPKKENNVNKRENITRKDEDKNQETQKLNPPKKRHNLMHQQKRTRIKITPRKFFILKPRKPTNNDISEENRLILHSILDYVYKGLERMRRNIWSVISSYYNEKVGCTLEIDVFKKVTQKEAEKEMKQEENGEKLIIYISD
ncbi:hypothetical protein CWI38_0094p0010 [Hamiltosporidium tvaerminnensis]|uniref:Uncharacterized protein n=1 Tax=Hamiltosporidium tvaerminnensis TaxID=1176355 RepID=A0A4Q9M0V8_9MICR|nr:hypothetical protein CWI38_0094p0010 [Hamiltosporidium tvaerminnensis]